MGKKSFFDNVHPCQIFVGIFLAAGLFAAGCGSDDAPAKTKSTAAAPPIAAPAPAPRVVPQPAPEPTPTQPSANDGKEAAVGDYHMRLPQGFQLGPPTGYPAKVAKEARIWHGPLQGESQPVVLSMVQQATASLVPDKDLPPALESSLKRLGFDGSDVKVTPGDRLQINGMEAIRGTVAGKIKQDGPSVTGVVYAAIDDTSSIVLLAVDSGPDAAAGMAKLDAALLTFHKAGEDDPAVLAKRKEPLVVTVTPLGQIGVKFVTDELNKAVAGKAFVLSKQETEGYAFTIKPGGDIQKVARKISFGTVTNLDEDKRTMTVAPDMTKVPQDPLKVAENPDHPEFVKQNLIFLKGAKPELRTAALTRLVAMDVSKAAPDDKIEVARAMLECANKKSETPETRAKAVDGLVAWAGHYSVPKLCLLLKDSAAPVRKAALRGLEDATDEVAIEPLAEVFTSSAQADERTAAGDILRTFGSKAEDAVINHARTQTTEGAKSSEAAKATVALLGEIGTKKSAAFLSSILASMARKKTNTPDNAYKEEVTRAIQEIKLRKTK